MSASSPFDLNVEYWNQRYRCGDTPWDVGYASPALVEFFQTKAEKNMKILIPGAGNAHEAVWLHENGFRQVYVCDWADKAFDRLREKAPDFPAGHLLIQDFFQLKGSYDLIIEQTFFCALHPVQRQDYVEQMHHLLVKGGRLAGLLFATHFPGEGPPFGGSFSEYQKLFGGRFHIREMQLCKNSIPPRANNELFFVVEKL